MSQTREGMFWFYLFWEGSGEVGHVIECNALCSSDVLCGYSCL